MRVDLIPHHGLIDSEDLKGKTAVVIDILRATSTIISALENGAAYVIPVETPTDAEQLAFTDRSIILAGEKEGIKIKGFRLGNSPLEFTPAKVKNKVIAHCTTNGTKTILKCSGADYVLIGSLLNRSACLDYAGRLKKDIVLVCAGRKNGPAEEDSLCAGAFAEYLRQNYFGYSFSKISMDAYYLYKINAINLHDRVYKSPSGQNLIGMGLKVDIDFCLRKDVYSVVALYKNGVIKKIENNEMY
ncbi:2-phosphosulfolactate phosphatase [Thermincola ferriacetica]